MIYLNPKDFKSVSEKHFNELKDRVTNRVEDRKRFRKDLKKFIIDNLSVILKGEPRRLKNINAKFYQKTAKIVGAGGKPRKYDKHLRYIFNYGSFRGKKKKQYDAYDLAANLGIRVCSYCNRMYTLTIQTDKKTDNHITRPEFDHFFSQERYPLLALSFFNLIPSCKICNSTLKGTNQFKLYKNLHPYLDDSWKGFRFSFVPTSTHSMLGVKLGSKIEVKTDVCKDQKLERKIKKSIKEFRIEEIYNGHEEEISDLIKLRNILNDNYLEILKKHTYPHLNISDDELYRLAFGVYRTEADYYKRPFSKLKKDILKELGIVV